MRPRVSIVTACFCSERFLERTFESIARQSGVDCEWVVVEDASPDGTPQLLERLAGDGRMRINLRRLDRNRGPVAAIAEGIALAKGEFVFILDHDDELAPGGLERLDAAWRSYPGDRSLLSGVGGRCVDERGAFIGTPFPMSPMVTDELSLRHQLRIRGELTGIVRTDLLQHWYRDLEPGMTNGVVWRRIARRWKALYTNEVVRVYHTETSGSMTNAAEVAHPAGAAAQLLIDINENFDFAKDDPVYFARGITLYLWFSRLAGVPRAVAIERIDPRAARILAAAVGRFLPLVGWLRRQRTARRIRGSEGPPPRSVGSGKVT